MHTKLDSLLQKTTHETTHVLNDKNAKFLAAAALDNSKLSKYVERGVKPNSAQDDYGNNAAHYAAAYNNLGTYQYLNTLTDFDRKKVNIRDYTYLHTAATFNNMGIVKYLVEEWNIDITVKNSLGKTAQDIATDKGYEDIATYLAGKASAIQATNNNVEIESSLSTQGITRQENTNFTPTTLPQIDDFLKTPGNNGPINLNLSQLSYDSEDDNIINIVIQIAAKISNIHSLNLSGCLKKPNAASIKSLAEHLPHLRCLNLSSCHITDEEVEIISNSLPELNFLGLEKCYAITSSGLISIARMKHLTSLDLGACQQIKDADIKIKDADIKNLTGLCNLTSLNLSYCANLKDAGVNHIIFHFQTLTSLYISGYSITDKAIKKIADKMHNLTLLDLSWCPKMTDSSLIKIANTMQNLTSLNLSECYKITDIGCAAIAQSMPNLTYLNFSACKNISNDALSQVRQALPIAVIIAPDGQELPKPQLTMEANKRENFARIETAKKIQKRCLTM